MAESLNVLEELDDLEFAKMKEIHDQILTRGEWTGITESAAAPQMSSLIQKKKYYPCLGGGIRTPGEFYVVPLENWNPLEYLMVELQKYYEEGQEAKGKNYGVPWKGHLLPGLVIGARYKPDMEFHRAKIISVLDNDRFWVQFLDYGDIVIAPYDEIRYLPLKYLHAMAFQAIPCSLEGFRHPASAGTRDEGEFFRQLILDKPLAIQFKEDWTAEGHGVIWEVDVHIYDEALGKISEFNVQRQVLEQCGRSANNSEEGGGATQNPDQKVEISKFKV